MLHNNCLLPFSLASDLEASPLGPESNWDSESSPFPNSNWSSMQPPMMWRASSGTQPSSLDTSCVDTDAMSSKTDMEDATSGMQGEDTGGYGGPRMFCADGMGSSSSVQLPAMTAGMEYSEDPPVMFDQLVVETEALVERMNSLSRAGGTLDDVPSLGVLLGIEDMNPSDEAHRPASPTHNAGRTLDELLVSEPDVMDMLDWPYSLQPWKGEGEEAVNNPDVSHSSLTSLAFISSNRQHNNNNSNTGSYRSSSATALSNVETVQSLGATSDVDDLELLDDDTDANDESYVPAEEKRRRSTTANGIARSGSPHSSSATDQDLKRQKKRNLFQSPPINEVVKLLGLSGRWRKYGRKVMKDCPYPAHYYKCAVPGCDAKRKVWYDSSETLQVQGKGDDHTHPPLSKSDVLGNHRMRRRKANTPSPEGSLSPSSSASEEAAESFYSTADSRSAPALGGGGGKATGGGKGKRVAWPRLPNPRWRFRRCTPEDQSQQQQQQQATGVGAKAGQQLQLQLYDSNGKTSAKKESHQVGSEDEGGPPKMGEWFDAFSLSSARQQYEQQQLSLEHHAERKEESLFKFSSGGVNNSTKLGDTSRLGGASDLGFDALYDWQDKCDDHMLIFTPVYGRQHSWRRLRRQLSNDIMQFDSTF